MRLSCIMTAVVLLADGGFTLATTEREQTELAAVTTAHSALRHRYLTAERVVEEETTRPSANFGDLELSAEDEERGYLERLQFWYWYKMKRTPTVVYGNLFKNADHSVAVNNPKYPKFERYKAYYEGQTQAK